MKLSTQGYPSVTQLGRSSRAGVAHNIAKQRQALGVRCNASPKDRMQGLADWLACKRPLDQEAIRSSIEIDDDGVGKAIFAPLVRALESPAFAGKGQYCACDAAELLFALLSPVANKSPDEKKPGLLIGLGDRRRALMTPSLSLEDVKSVLREAFGSDTLVLPSGSVLSESDMRRVKAWASVALDGTVWVTAHPWRNGGAFKINIPLAGSSETNKPIPHFTVAWDEQMRSYSTRHIQSNDIVWFTEAAEAFTVADKLPKINSGVQSLLLDPQFDAINSASAPVAITWRNSVELSYADGNLIRPLGRQFQRSDVLSRSEAWLAGVRYQQLCNGNQPLSVLRVSEGVDPEALASLLHNSIAACPVEQRLAGILHRLEKGEDTPGTGLKFYDEGDLLLQTLSDLLASEIEYAAIDRPFEILNRPPVYMDFLIQSQGELQAWLEPIKANSSGREQYVNQLINPITHQLKIHVSGPAFGDSPVLLIRDVRLKGGFLAGDLQVRVGAKLPFPHTTAPRLVVLLDKALEPETRIGMLNRASVHSEFWNTVFSCEQP